MSTDENIALIERYKYLRLVQKHYRELGRAKRQALLDEMEAVTGLHRKSLIRLMNSDLTRRVLAACQMLRVTATAR